jgi:rhodanese-related sulfurtransferase
VAESAPEVRPFARARPLREASLLLALSLVAAGLSWAVRTPRLPLRADLAAYELDLGFPVVPAAEAVALFLDNACIPVDTRAGAPARRIPGSFALGQETFDDDLREVFDFLSPADPLLVYGDGNLLVAAAVAGRLRERGFTDIRLLQGSLDVWEQAGGEIQAGEGGAGHD